MHQFFISIDNIEENRIRIAGDDLHHMKDVVRLKKGEEFCCLDGKGNRYICELNSYEDREAYANILEVCPVEEELPSRIVLFQGYPKGDKMELIVQKCVELGVSEIVPVLMERSVARPDAKTFSKKQKRFQTIAEAAAKQAQRGMIPTIHDMVKFDKAIDMAKEFDVFLFPYEASEGMNKTREILSGIRRGESVAVFIGPEGGFALGEVAKAQEAGAKVITLGKRILRTETAPIAVLSILMYLLEED